MPMTVMFTPRFCPNADIFLELQFDQPQTRVANAVNSP
jgi:hypothetical protein